MAELSDTQKAELKQKLLTLRDDLEQILAASRAGAQPVDLDQPIGRLSRMDALQQQELTKASRDGAKRRLQLVDSALQALRSNRYGECRRCEEPISLARLQAQPETPFCLDCQGRIEKEH